MEFLKEEILSDARLVYQAREEAIGSESMRELERRVVLSVIGRKWQEHLYEMDDRVPPGRDPSDARLVYQAREQAIGSESMRELERRVVLSVIGRKWQEHLYEMDYLKEGIGLRAMAQRDPLVEYQREGFIMFQAMMEAIREESVGFLFNLEVEVTPAEDVVVADAAGQHTEHHEPQIHAAGLEAPEKPAQLQYTAPGEDGAAQTRIEAKVSGTLGKPGQGSGAGHAAALRRRSGASARRPECSGRTGALFRSSRVCASFPSAQGPQPGSCSVPSACCGLCFRPASVCRPLADLQDCDAPGRLPRSSRSATARTRNSSTTTALAS